MKLAHREATLLVALGVLLVVVGGYFAVNWYVKTLRDSRLELQVALAELKKVEEKVRNLESLKQRLAEVSELQKEYERLVPKEEEIPQLLRDTDTILTNAGVDLLSFVPGQGSPVATVPEYKKLSVAIAAKGTYPEILRMFDALRSWRRLIGITDFTLTGGGAGGANDNDVTLRCQFNMVVFYTAQ